MYITRLAINTKDIIGMTWWTFWDEEGKVVVCGSSCCLKVSGVMVLIGFGCETARQ